MADFKVKNGLQAKRYLQTTTALASTATAIDLSKGNNFSITPSGNPTFTFTNPPATGKAQAFSVEVTGGSNGMDDIFSIDLWTSDGSSTQTITNNIDLSNEGGLVWIKDRSTAKPHVLVDTARISGNTDNYLMSDSTNAQTAHSNEFGDFTSTGYTLPRNTEAGYTNTNTGRNYVGWTFRKASNFFDVVTYSGNSTNGRTVSHNLGSDVGMILLKKTDASGNWLVWHRGQSSNYGYLNLTNTFASAGAENYFGNGSSTVSPTSTQVTLGANSAVNGSGNSYVMYLFAHNSSTVSCGSYTGNGSATGPTVDVGFQPQWIMIKRASGGTGDWDIYDSTRGIPDGAGDLRLEANTSDAESTPGVDRINVSSSGFSIATTNSNLNTNGDTYIYVAIAASAAGSLTWPTSVKYSGGTAPSSPALGKKDVFTFMTVDGGTSYVGKKAVEGLS